MVYLTLPGFQVFAARFAAAAQTYKLPSIGFLKTYAHAGLLMSYGLVQELYFPLAVVLADKIVRGKKPGDMPIEQPITFELTVNLKTAKALGLVIPRSLLLRADEVIQ